MFLLAAKTGASVKTSNEIIIWAEPQKKLYLLTSVKKILMFV